MLRNGMSISRRRDCREGSCRGPRRRIGPRHTRSSCASAKTRLPPLRRDQKWRLKIARQSENLTNRRRLYNSKRFWRVLDECRRLSNDPLSSRSCASVLQTTAQNLVNISCWPDSDDLGGAASRRLSGVQGSGSWLLRTALPLLVADSANALAPCFFRCIAPHDFPKSEWLSVRRLPLFK